MHAALNAGGCWPAIWTNCQPTTGLPVRLTANPLTTVNKILNCITATALFPPHNLLPTYLPTYLLPVFSSLFYLSPRARMPSFSPPCPSPFSCLPVRAVQNIVLSTRKYSTPFLLGTNPKYLGPGRQ